MPMDRMFMNLDRYGNTSAASVPIALAEAVNSGRVARGDKLVFVAFGAGFTSGGVAMEWTADPARGPIGDAAVSPEDVVVRLPVDWDSVDPIPPALAEVLRRPLPGRPRPLRRGAGRARPRRPTRPADRSPPTRRPTPTRDDRRRSTA